MPNTVYQYKVFVSCPGDAEPQKNQVKIVSESIERILDQLKKPVSIRVLYWKDLTGGYGLRPQSIINEAFNEYDFYLGILYKRFGTGTKNELGDEFESGTEEEFFEAIKKRNSGEPVEIFFYFKKVHLAPEEEPGLGQYNKVKDFYSRIKQFMWVNHFDDDADFTTKLYDLLFPLVGKEIDEQKTELKKEFISEVSDIKIDGVPIVESFLEEIVVPENPIARTVSPVQGSIFHLVSGLNQSRLLHEIVGENNKVVLLGNAGSGKSIELGRLADHYSSLDKPSIPFFIKLNKFQRGAFEQLLPEGWENVPEHLSLFIFDGLDEVEPKLFSEISREIIKFTEKFQEAKVVVSCRTNFFHLPEESSEGTLPDFNIYTLDELQDAQIKEYIGQAENKGNMFMKEAIIHGYEDLVSKPFFLEILSKIYLTYNSLSGGRKSVFDLAIKQRISQSGIQAQEVEIVVKHLSRLAIVMETLGRNFIATEELKLIFPENDILEKVLTSGLLYEKNTVWSFEHNNFQEYLAASILVNRDFDQIKKMVAFPTDYTKIKPTWWNTLSFLVSLLEGDKLKRLIEWMAETEPEAMIRFEPDRIPFQTRRKIFEGIFNNFKTKGLFIRSNQFEIRDLALFSSSEETLSFLLKVIDDPYEGNAVKINALYLLKYFDVKDDIKGEVLNVLLGQIQSHVSNGNFVYIAANVLSALSLVNNQVIDSLIPILKKSHNEYLRAAMYALLIAAKKENEYVELLIEGVDIIEYDQGDGREQINLWDETALLRDAIAKISDPKGVSSIINFLLKNLENGYSNFDRGELLKSVVQNAIIAYPIDKSIYLLMIKLLIGYSRFTNNTQGELIANFFKETATGNKAFIEIFKDERVRNWEKTFALSHLLSDQVIATLLRNFKKGDLTEPDLTTLYHDLSYHLRSDKDKLIMNNFQKMVVVDAGIILDATVKFDFQALITKRKFENLEMLLDPMATMAEVERFFTETGETLATWDKVWNFSHGYEINKENTFLQGATNILLDFTRKNRSVTFEEIKNWMSEEDHFLDYRVNEIYQFIKSYPGFEFTPEQHNFIQQWMNLKSGKLDIRNALYEDNTGSIGINQKVLIIWFFISRFDFEIITSKLLDFTLFGDFEANQEHKSFEIIRAKTSDALLQQRVIENIREGVEIDFVWENNTRYAIAHGIESLYAEILAEIVETKYGYYARQRILRYYFENTEDFTSLSGLLDIDNKNEIRWDIISILKNDHDHTTLISFLKEVLSSEDETAEQRLLAAKRLTELNDLTGFNYYADFLLSREIPEQELNHWQNSFATFNNPEAVPKLLDLLEHSFLPSFQDVEFNRMESQVTDALYLIGLSSKENLEQVINGFNALVSRYSPGRNYLFYMIDRMRHQFYQTKQKNITVAQILVDLKDHDI